jgi:uncharacterized protein (TIGR02246 family)
MHQDQNLIVTLYKQLLTAWNDRDADRFAAQFTLRGQAVGFDGSQMSGRAAIAASLRGVFSDHETATYVARIEEVVPITSDAFLLRARAGMLKPKQKEPSSDTTAIQSLIAVKESDLYRIALYQNTPAAFHGRPQLVQEMTDDLRKIHASGRMVAFDT